jgi:hypothetical protein
VAHYRGAKNDASNDFGNDPGLADLGQRPMQDMADDDDEGDLIALALASLAGTKQGCLWLLWRH